MKLVLVLDRLEWGGITSFVDNITSKLVDKDVMVTIIGGREKGRSVLPKEYFINKRIKIKSFCFDGKKLWQRDWSLVWNAFKIVVSYLQLKKTDLVVVNNSGSGLGAIMAAKINRVPVVYHFHGAWNIEEKNGIDTWSDFGFVRFWKTKIRLNLYWLIEKICLSWSDKVLVLSQASLKMIGENFGIISSNRIGFFTPGVNIEYFRPLIRSRTKNLLLGVGRTDTKKGWINLIEAVKNVEKVRLVIAGLSDDKKRMILERKVMSFGLMERIKLVDYWGKEEKKDNYQKVDLLVVPSVGYEAYPTVIMEAMACGCPVVGTPVGGIVEMLLLVDKRLVIESTSVGALINKIKWFVALTEKEKMSLSYRCRQVAKFYWDVDKNVDNLVKIYRSLCIDR